MRVLWAWVSWMTHRAGEAIQKDDAARAAIYSMQSIGRISQKEKYGDEGFHQQSTAVLVGERFTLRLNTGL